MLSEVRERQVPYDFTHMWCLKTKNKINKQTKKNSSKPTPKYREQPGGCERGSRLGDGRNRWRRLRGKSF